MKKQVALKAEEWMQVGKPVHWILGAKERHDYKSTRRPMQEIG